MTKYTKSKKNKFSESQKREVPISSVRNIGLVAHIDAGKTTTTERILYYSGINYRLGEVHEGTATMDWMDQEQERGITITSAATTCSWDNCKINIIDTPGHVDFTAEVERSLRILDGAVGVFCAVGGVQSQSETVWKQAKKYDVPVLAFVNKMDRVGADLNNVVNEIREKLNTIACPLQVPIGHESDFKGIIDIIEEKTIYFDQDSKGSKIIVEEVPEEYKAKVEEAKHHLLECLAEVDEDLMESFLNDEVPNKDSIKKALRQATIDGEIVPVLCGSAFKNKGVQPLLDSIVDYLPSPVDSWSINGHDPETDEEKSVHVGDEQPFAGLVFKIMSDPYVGKLAFFRVYSGTAQKGMKVYNPRNDKEERLGRILQMHANSRENREALYSGDIAAAVGLKNVNTGDTICSRDNKIMLETMNFPEPVISIAVEPKTTEDKNKLMKGLTALASEDPTFRVNVDDETGQTVISGMGELHLEIIKNRLLKEHNVEANTGKPQVSYRESISHKAKGDVKFERQTGGKGQYGHVILNMYPVENASGITIENKVTGGNIPKEYIQSVKDGIKEAAYNGVVGGYPVTDFHIDIIDGSYHTVDSSELSFSIAGSMAFKDAMKKAGPYLLEPIMKLEITTPDTYMGDVIGEVSGRRGSVVEVDTKDHNTNIIAHIPLAEMFGYATTLRSITRGRASYSMEPSHFASVPSSIQESILEKG